MQLLLFLKPGERKVRYLKAGYGPASYVPASYDFNRELANFFVYSDLPEFADVSMEFLETDAGYCIVKGKRCYVGQHNRTLSPQLIC